MKRLLMVVSAFFLLGSTANAAVFDFEDHWYEVVTQGDAITWKVAQDKAHGKDGYLVSITSAAENDFVANFLPESNFSGYWLGGYQVDGAEEPTGGWAWDSGEDWVEKWGEDSVPWEKNEPNNGMGGTQDYLHFWQTNGKWDDMENRHTM